MSNFIKRLVKMMADRKRSVTDAKKTKKHRLKSISKTKLLIASGILFIALFIPVPYAATKAIETEYTTEQVQTAEIELGESRVAQEGENGQNIIHLTKYQSVLGWLFGVAPSEGKVTKEDTVKKPVNRIVHEGTRKYQYMLCSGGGYRYFTDDQFKNPSTGFTSKSEDYCKKFGQGEKVKLADSPNGNGAGATNGVQSSPTANPTNKPAPSSLAHRDPVCTKKTIPHRVYNRYVNYLEYGVVQVSMQGEDGWTETCVDGNTGVGLPSWDVTKNPQPRIIDNGRGRTPLTYSEKRSNYDTCQMASIPGLSQSCEHELQ